MSVGNTNPSGSGGQILWLHINDAGELLDPWSFANQAEETVDDNDKTLVVPADTDWELMTLWVELVSTATAGNRQLAIEFLDSGDDVIGQVRAGAVQAASLTRYYMFGQGLIDLTSFRDTDFLTTPLPSLILPAGYKVRIYDNANVDATDDLIVQMMVKARNTAD